MRLTRVVVVAALLLGGCDARSHRAGDTPTPLVVVPPAPLTTKIVGATPKQRKALVEILSGLGPTRVARIEVAPAAPRWTGAPKDVQNLDFAIPEFDRVANWHAELIAEAMRVRSHQLGLPPVDYFSGGRGGELLASDPTAETHEPELTLSKATEIAESIRATAARHGAKVRRLELIRPRRYAFLVVIQADDPADFLRNGFDELMKPLDDLGISGYEGRSIVVLDSEGKPVLESGGWFWVRTDVGACVHVITGSPPDPPPPPCPAD
jgi:hypothetical protein